MTSTASLHFEGSKNIFETLTFNCAALFLSSSESIGGKYFQSFGGTLPSSCFQSFSR